MLKKTITFEDLDGNLVTEDFYFNLNKAEITEMELSRDGGLSDHLKKIIETKDAAQVIATFKEILLKSVGRRSEDGRRFIKNDEIRAEFEQSDAYSTLFMELITDADASSEFIKAIVPSNLANQLDDVQLPEPAKDDIPAWKRENREPTPEEIRNMSQAELTEAFRIRNAQ